MMIWLGLLFYIFLVRIFLGSLNTNINRKRFLILAGFGIVLIMGFRYPQYKIVYDLRSYYEYYNKMHTTKWLDIFTISRFEPGYAVTNKLLSTIIPWPQFILIFEAMFCVYCMFRFIYKNTQFTFHAVIFYISLGTMFFQLTAFRQAIAISICLLSTEAIKEKKLIKYVLLVILAASFHKTAFVFLPFYFIANRQPNLKTNIISLIGIISASYVAEFFTKFGNDLFDMRYGGYIGNKFGGMVPIIIYILTIILTLIHTKKLNNSIPLNMTITGLIIYLTRYATLALERISFFFTPAAAVQLPNAIALVKDAKLRRILSMLSIVLAVLLYMYRLSTSEFGEYRFFWQGG